MRRLFRDDPQRGMKLWWHDSDDGKSFSIEYEQDAQPIIELNKEKQKAGRAYYAQDDEMWRVASIPVGVQLKWLVEHGVDVLNEEHWPRVKRLLNDPEWRYLKTAEIII